jgi:predicted nucleic acid-binding protein
MPPSDLLVLDANVLIDYSAADKAVLSLASRHVGAIHVPSVLLEEVDGLDESECARLGLVVIEPETSLLVAAGRRRPGLSYYDHLCLLCAKAAGWTCVTNDGRLRRESAIEQVPVLWGLELMVPLVAGRHLAASAAITVAEGIQAANPLYITEEIVARFRTRIARAASARRPRGGDVKGS